MHDIGFCRFSNFSKWNNVVSDSYACTHGKLNPEYERTSPEPQSDVFRTPPAGNNRPGIATQIMTVATTGNSAMPYRMEVWNTCEIVAFVLLLLRVSLFCAEERIKDYIWLSQNAPFSAKVSSDVLITIF